LQIEEAGYKFPFFQKGKPEISASGVIMFCTACGGVNEDTARFCFKCGAAIRVPPHAAGGIGPGAAMEPRVPVAAAPAPAPSADPAPGAIGSPAPLSAQAAKAAAAQTPEDKARVMVDFGAILAGIIAALHFYQIFTLDNKAYRFIPAILFAVCAVVAWKLWTKSSIVAGMVAFFLFGLEGVGAIVIVGMFSGNRVVIMNSGDTKFLALFAIVCFAAAYFTLLGIIRLRKFAANRKS
jgi:hypothetical protein